MLDTESRHSILLDQGPSARDPWLTAMDWTLGTDQSLQDMLDCDIKSEIDSVIGGHPELGFNFTDLSPLELDDDPVGCCNTDLNGWFNSQYNANSNSSNRSSCFLRYSNFNLDLSGCDAASMVVNPNLAMPSHVSVRAPTPGASAAAAESTSGTTTGSTTTNGIKRHFNFALKPEPKAEKPSRNGPREAEDGTEAEIESEDERHYENEASSEDDSDESESEDEAPSLPRATAQPHGLKLTIPSSAAKAKTTLLLPASSIKTLSPTLLKASQQQGAGIKVNGLPAGIRLQNFKIVGPNGHVQQLRRPIYGAGGVQAHIVTQAQAQQQQLLQQQLAAAVVATGANSPSGPRKQDKDLDALGHDYDDKAYPKPAYSYSCLIAMALKNSQTGSLPVSEIYNFMCEHFPYFKTAPNGWKNSVRHNLSLNKCFEKIEKPAGNGNQRKGCLWAINPAKVAKMDEEVQKWSRKDPLAIKKAMIYPDHLELLERGEMKFVGSGSNGDLSEETESSGDEEAEGPDDGPAGHGHQLAANSVTDSYDESSQDCDVDVSEQLYDEIDIDENKDALHMQLNISKQDDYQLIPSAKRQKTLTGTLQANYVYQPVATARRKTPLTFLTTGAAAGSFLKIE